MATDRIELVPSGAQTASGAGAWMPVPNCTMAMVGVDVTAVSSLTAFDVYLEGSDDGGTTSYEIPLDLAMKHSGAAGSGNTVATNRRNIVESDETVAKHVGIYKHLPTDRIRLAWKMTGTSVTFSASAVVK